MLDIVASHQHKLPVSVEIEGVDNAKPWLPRPPACGSPDSVSKQHADGDHEQRQNDENDDYID